MEKEQFDEIREFARSLTQKRQVMADGPLLDLCQQHLNALVAELAGEFEEAPHLNARAEPEQPEMRPPESSPLADEEEEPEHRQAQHHPAQHQQQHHKKAPTKKHR